jgi:hypothetical protein
MKSLKYLFAFTFLVVVLSGCKYSFIVPVEVIDPDDPDAPQISYAAEIQPIFDSKCTYCHDGSRNPNLTSGNSYSSLSSGGYINTDNPEESKIYTQTDPTAGGSHMKVSAAESALLLAWIKQGAKDN